MKTRRVICNGKLSEDHCEGRGNKNLKKKMFGTLSKTRVENGKKKIGNRKKRGEKYEKYERNIMKLNW